MEFGWIQKKIKIVEDHPVPKNQNQVRQYLGLCNYYRRFIEGYSKITVPLNKLLQSDQKFIWTPECQKSFDLLKSKLTSAPILAFPDMSKEFFLTTDASGNSLGYILGQKDNKGREKVISNGGRALRKAEKKWTVSEKECLAVLEGIKHNKVYLSHNRFSVITDHKALVWLNKTKDTNAKLGRWALELQNFEFDIIYKEGAKNQNADAISRIPYPIEDDKNDIEQDNDKSINAIHVENDSNDNKMLTEISFEYENPRQFVSAIVDNTQVRLDNMSEIATLQRECTEL